MSMANDDNDNDDSIEIYIGPERPDTHYILLRGLEQCMRCYKDDPVVLLVVPRGHQVICADCLNEEERETYRYLVERVSEWEHEQSKRASPKEEDV